MSSYDRLFPNQDTMPRGGFGNLIALPVQNEPRKQGNTLFVDEQWKTYEDQWAFLASIRRMTRRKDFGATQVVPAAGADGHVQTGKSR